MTTPDTTFIRESFKLAQESVNHGNQPFGAVLADSEGNVLLTAENTEVTDDFSGHAEFNLLMSDGRKEIPKDKLVTSTLYSSTEPCFMCMGFFIKSEIGNLVYGCSSESLKRITGRKSPVYPCREFIERVGKKINVRGPVLEEEAAVLHESYWPKKTEN